ncbi:MAG: hypothetical protein C5S48_09430 [Candidatus Methanogaster sp.]|nr:MAG: hypothetical protein C5S48_09430 [ANME-2 cluster archaeon]
MDEGFSYRFFAHVLKVKYISVHSLIFASLSGILITLRGRLKYVIENNPDHIIHFDGTKFFAVYGD